MSLAASTQITDQDIYTQSSYVPSELIGQKAATSDGRGFSLGKAGGTLTAGQITEPAAITANYANRALTTSAAAGANQVTVVLGTTASADAFVGFWLVVNDNTGQGQGAYYITGNTAATAGNSNTTVVSIKGALAKAISSTATATDVTIIPNQQSAVIQHTAVVAIPTAGAPVIDVTSGNYFWNQVTGMASILSDGTIGKNSQGIVSDATAGAVEVRVDATVTVPVGYAPEATTTTDYSPFVLTLLGV
jgi:hypothetical protein